MRLYLLSADFLASKYSVFISTLYAEYVYAYNSITLLFMPYACTPPRVYTYSTKSTGIRNQAYS